MSQNFYNFDCFVNKLLQEDTGEAVLLAPVYVHYLSYSFAKGSVFIKEHNSDIFFT